MEKEDWLIAFSKKIASCYDAVGTTNHKLLFTDEECFLSDSADINACMNFVENALNNKLGRVHLYFGDKSDEIVYFFYLVLEHVRLIRRAVDAFVDGYIDNHDSEKMIHNISVMIKDGLESMLIDIDFLGDYFDEAMDGFGLVDYKYKINPKIYDIVKKHHWE